jgi:hypothetical protein
MKRTIDRLEELAKEIFDEPKELTTILNFDNARINVEISGFKNKIGVVVSQWFSLLAIEMENEKFYQMIKADFLKMIDLRVQARTTSADYKRGLQARTTSADYKRGLQARTIDLGQCGTHF